LRHFRLGVIGAMSFACILATAPASNAVELTAPVATTTGTYQGLKNFQELPGDPASGVNVFFGIRYGQAIGGESAGGLSVSTHLASTNTFRGLTGRNLFGGAIIESGAYMYHDLPSLATYQTLSNTFAQQDANALCGGTLTLACLQGLSVAQVFKNEPLFGGFGIAPNFGTKIPPLDLHTAFSTGRFNHVPVLQGTNANEGRLFEPSFFPGAVTAPKGTSATIIAAGGPASFDLQVPNILCATPQFTGTPAVCSYLQEIQFFLETLVTATPSNSGPTSPFTEAVVAASTTAARQYPIANFHNFVPPTASSSLNNNFGGGNVDEALSQIFTDIVFACNGFDSNSDLSNQVPVFAYEFNDPNAPALGTPGVLGPGANGSGFTTASQHAAELQYIFNFGAAFTSGQATLATDMKTYWANFVKTRNSNLGSLEIFVSLKAQRAQLPFWPHFNAQDNHVQSLTPPGLLTPRGPQPFDTFRTEHFCATWQPLLTFNNGNEPQQP
jgi:para-nitrobenzyl esterase